MGKKSEDAKASLMIIELQRDSAFYYALLRLGDFGGIQLDSTIRKNSKDVTPLMSDLFSPVSFLAQLFL